MITHNGITIDFATRTISHAGAVLPTDERLVTRGRAKGGYRFEMFARMILQPSTRDELFNMVFDAYPDGGPDLGARLVNVRLHQWRNRFAQLKLKLVKEKRAGCLYFSLVPDVV